MKLITQIRHICFSTDTDHRFAKSLKKVKEADQVSASINERLLEIKKSFNSKSIELS
jgi:hypothetical protein